MVALEIKQTIPPFFLKENDISLSYTNNKYI